MRRLCPQPQVCTSELLLWDGYLNFAAAPGRFYRIRLWQKRSLHHYGFSRRWVAKIRWRQQEIPNWDLCGCRQKSQPRTHNPLRECKRGAILIAGMIDGSSTLLTTAPLKVHTTLDFVHSNPYALNWSATDTGVVACERQFRCTFPELFLRTCEMTWGCIHVDVDTYCTSKPIGIKWIQCTMDICTCVLIQLVRVSLRLNDMRINYYGSTITGGEFSDEALGTCD